MKTTKAIIVFLCAIFTTGIIVQTSCKKENESKQYSYRAAIDNSTAEGAFTRAYNQISKAARQVSNKSTNDTIQGCPVLYITGAWPQKTVTLDFGTGCTCDDGVVRRGKIISVTNGLYIDEGTTIVSTFDNYYETINGVDYQVQGTQTIVNTGNNQDGHPVYSMTVQNGSVTSVHGTIQWNAQLYIEWIAGFDTWMNPFDNEFSTTGSASGNDINGAPFQVNITSPLISKFCTSLFRWLVVSGKIDIVNPGYPTITVDYGTGTCDYVVYVIINDVTYTVVLS